MLSGSVFVAALVAGTAYVLTPGPGFVAILSSVSLRPPRVGWWFCLGLLAGSSVWLIVTVATFAGAGALPARALDGLAVCCALYLAYLGTRLVLSARAGGARHPLRRPLREGLSAAGAKYVKTCSSRPA